MKTYAQWFNEKLPRKLAKKAIAYNKEQFKDNPLGLNEKHDNFKSALMWGFIWQKTDELHGFWSQIYDNNGMSKPKPKRKVESAAKALSNYLTAYGVKAKWTENPSSAQIFNAGRRYERRRLRAKNEN